MKIEPFEFGLEHNRLVVIDDFLSDAQGAVEIAKAIEPFAPERATAYPGLRHQLTPDQSQGAAYVRAVLAAAAPVVCRMYGVRSFDIVEASFSIVTRRPADLEPRQRLPHFDSFDPDHVAILHHLHRLPDTGTAFYRHSRTGFETASEARRSALEVAWAQDQIDYGDPKAAFAAESDGRYERIFSVAGRFNRLLVYQGALFHSGILPPDFAFDSNPATGRLTGTIFLKLNRRAAP